jgi:hypothetical protein
MLNMGQNLLAITGSSCLRGISAVLEVEKKERYGVAGEPMLRAPEQKKLQYAAIAEGICPVAVVGGVEKGKRIWQL